MCDLIVRKFMVFSHIASYVHRVVTSRECGTQWSWVCLFSVELGFSKCKLVSIWRSFWKLLQFCFTSCTMQQLWWCETNLLSIAIALKSSDHKEMAFNLVWWVKSNDRKNWELSKALNQFDKPLVSQLIIRVISIWTLEHQSTLSHKRWMSF